MTRRITNKRTFALLAGALGTALLLPSGTTLAMWSGSRTFAAGNIATGFLGLGVVSPFVHEYPLEPARPLLEHVEAGDEAAPEMHFAWWRYRPGAAGDDGEWFGPVASPLQLPAVATGDRLIVRTWVRADIVGENLRAELVADHAAIDQPPGSHPTVTLRMGDSVAQAPNAAVVPDLDQSVYVQLEIELDFTGVEVDRRRPQQGAAGQLNLRLMQVPDDEKH